MFPPEIMCFIFKEMCISQLQDLDHVLARLPGSLEYGRECIFSAVHDDLDEDFDTFSILKAVRTPGFSPYAVASVCQYWDGILSSNPSFWNTIVIFIDQMDWTELHIPQAYFTRSGNLPIDVFFIRKIPGYQVHDDMGPDMAI
ncbi:hypothetical protein CVT26_010597 [Gymnopilus dilepis]|uniref:F-box domain-containing protein n=1 Tax=Gymnopilus dilepis TaxID=231916 RepID=A0A409VZG0_9AGAR|nr:hypothetical protein CVT26_010597 [Gymnopilus dilepis]